MAKGIPAALRTPIKEPRSGFNGRFDAFALDYFQTWVEPYRLDHFFRCLIQELNRQKVKEDDALMFLEFTGNKLVDSQPRLRAALQSILRKYKAVLRCDREEQEKGAASLDSREALAAANKVAEEALDSIKEE